MKDTIEKHAGPKKFRNKIMASLVPAMAVAILAAAPADATGNLSLILPEHLKGAEYVGSEDCTMCHEEEHKEYKLSTHSRLEVKLDDKDMLIQGCEMCHGPGSIHVENVGGKDNILNPRRDPSICFQCHTDKKLQFQLPYRHPVMEGKMACADCHSSHGPDARPWTTTSMESVNETCYECHKMQRGPFVWEHEATEEGCTTCHQVHGSVHEKMLLVRDNNLCLRCHAQVMFPDIGQSGHGSRLPQGTCFSAGCHTAVHGSNFDDHLRY